MAKVYRRENESIDDTLRRFKREVKKVGVLRDARKHEHYEKPVVIHIKLHSTESGQFCKERVPDGLAV